MITSELQSLPSENRRLFMLRKATTTNKQTYVIKSINTSSTIYAKSAHIETSVNMMTYYQSLLEIYLRLYTYKYIIYIYICIYKCIYKQPANRNIYFCNKKSTNFWNDRTIRFRRTKAVSFIFQVMCIQQRMCNNMITNFGCFWRTVFAQQIS